MNLSVIGLGKLGTPLLAVMASAGHRVIGVDVSAETVAALNARRVPDGLVEPGLEARLTDPASQYEATQNIKRAVRDTDATFIIVPTPSGDDGGFTLEYIDPVARDIGTALRDKDGYHLIAIVSTVMPGQTAQVVQTIEATSGKQHGRDFGVCYNPTFIALGNVIQNLIYPDYVLIGEQDEHDGNRLADIWRSVLANGTTPIRRMSWASAEVSKIAQNAFITMKITFANELGNLCGAIPGANVDDVALALGSDSRIGHKYLKAGTAYGGPCFPRDNRALRQAAKQAGADFEIAKLTDKLNGDETMILLRSIFYPTVGTIGILGLSYKPGTPSVEESQGTQVAYVLAQWGRSIIVYDPLAMDEARTVLGDSVDYATSAQDCIDQADVVVLMHDDPNLIIGTKWNGQTVIDPWRLVRVLPNDPMNYIPLGIGPQSEAAAA